MYMDSEWKYHWQNYGNTEKEQMDEVQLFYYQGKKNVIIRIISFFLIYIPMIDLRKHLDGGMTVISC